MTSPEGLLELLSRAGDRRVSGAALARALGLSRAAVHKQVDGLRRRGYRIDGVSRLGYRLEKRPAAAGFRGGLARSVFHFAELGSTQDDLKARASAGAPEGTLVVADCQTRGRGRLGRPWKSPVGGLWYSLLLRPPVRPEAVPALPLVAALDWVLSLRAEQVPARLKWPNDVWCGEKKLAGVLTEMSAETDRVSWVVLGVGMNVANPAPRRARVPAVSLNAATGRKWTREDLLKNWLERFTASYRRFLKEGFVPFRSAYEENLLLKGRWVSFEMAGARRSGWVSGVDNAGRLLMRVDGESQAYEGGEVRLLRLKPPPSADILKTE